MNINRMCEAWASEQLRRNDERETQREDEHDRIEEATNSGEDIEEWQHRYEEGAEND